MIPISAAILSAAATAALAAEPARTLIPVPSGAEVWLQEELTDTVPGMGLVQRFRFVMPALAELVPEAGSADASDSVPPEMLDETAPDDAPLTPSEQAELDEALGDLVVSAVPDAGAAPLDEAGGELSLSPALPGDGDGAHAPLPSQLSPPDSPPPGSDQPSDSEATGDLAAAGPALPAAPDILMQDPVHRDIVWLCEHYALPRLAAMSPRPSQVVISMASAPSPFGNFDPAVVQLFEGFSIPRNRDACIWEPL
ncbi:DUF6497 family protein [Paracoccus contaminans]|uniref:Uncharacterized protein n=1 Tax=Paracoccus contaminans TaxID=1945662 RepID=A0A1W6D067_9RHOB|nr:DUF6497 family protein [Paracoccus contaminans]ARJ70523.1 hypothetical protein B0A89_13660 [Paracoccus contaminans]